MKRNSLDKLTLGHVKINSIRNMFDARTYIIRHNIDKILISERKIDDTFLLAQFFIKGFSAPYRQDKNRTGRGLLLFVREDVPSRILNPKSKTDIETLSVEINLRKRKWFLNCSYNPHKNQISNHLECLNRLIDEYNTYYENFIFIGDFNTSVEESQMENFCNLNCLESLIQKPTCYKNPSQPTCIDLILTNRPSYFQHSEVFETNLSDFHLLTGTELEINFQKQKPKIIACRDYNKFDNNAFRHDIEKCNFNTADLKTFKVTVFCIFNKHVPMKRKYVRANEAPFMTKELHKRIMKRSRLRNKFLKNKNETNRNNYKLQRSYCIKLLKTTKKQYFNNLNTSKVTDNRTFWKTVVPLFTNKPSRGAKIILKEGNKNITNDSELCEVFNTYFQTLWPA